MLSPFGSKDRIIQAHMYPENTRLQAQYSHVFDFRNLTQQWLDIFVRWFLNEPLTEHSSPETENQSEPCEDPEHRSELVAHDLTASQICGVQEPAQNPRSLTTPQEAVRTAFWSPNCCLQTRTADCGAGKIDTVESTAYYTSRTGEFLGISVLWETGSLAVLGRFSC
jgi:hypothetical protein